MTKNEIIAQTLLHKVKQRKGMVGKFLYGWCPNSVPHLHAKNYKRSFKFTKVIVKKILLASFYWHSIYLSLRPLSMQCRRNTHANHIKWWDTAVVGGEPTYRAIWRANNKRLTSLSPTSIYQDSRLWPCDNREKFETAWLLALTWVTWQSLSPSSFWIRQSLGFIPVSRASHISCSVHGLPVTAVYPACLFPAQVSHAQPRLVGYRIVHWLHH